MQQVMYKGGLTRRPVRRPLRFRGLTPPVYPSQIYRIFLPNRPNETELETVWYGYIRCTKLETVYKG